jgi:hypothetical protein
MLLVRRAIREGWDTPNDVREAVVNDVMAVGHATGNPRRYCSAVRVLLAMEKNNIEVAALRAKERRPANVIIYQPGG